MSRTRTSGCRDDVRRVVAAFLISLFFAALQRPARAQEAEEGFEPLFRDRELTGWVREHGAGFQFDGQTLACTGAGDYPSWLRSEQTYENFVLRFDFRLGLYGEGGVFLHAPRHGRNANVGLEVQLSDDTRNAGPVTISSGAIFGAVPPREQASHPLGQWNEVEVRVEGPRVGVTLNGKLVQDLDLDQDERLRYRFREGHLGFQDRGARYEIRNARLKPLPGKTDWIQLFDGQTFGGWAVLQPDGATWRIENGELVAENGNGYLVTEREFENFELRTYIQSSPRANGGIFCRWKSLVPKDRGFEVQIEDIPDSNNPTGSIYDRVRANEMPFTPGEWTPLQIILQGPRCVVVLNGTKVAETDALDVIRAGHIALQMHRANSWIRFKDIRLRELPAP